MLDQREVCYPPCKLNRSAKGLDPMKEPVVASLPERPQPDPMAASWGWRAIIATLLLTIVTTLVLGLVVRSIASALGRETDDALISPAIYLLAVGVYIAVIVGIYLFAARQASWGALGLRSAHWSTYILVPPLFILELFALVAINSAVGNLVGGFENPQVEAITGGQTLSPITFALLLVLVAGLVPFAEELFFRGALYPLLRQPLGPVLAIILNAALFSVVHFIPLLMPGLFVVGLFLAFLRERSGSIWPSVCLHALQNGLGLLLISLSAALT